MTRYLQRASFYILLASSSGFIGFRVWGLSFILCLFGLRLWRLRGFHSYRVWGWLIVLCGLHGLHRVLSLGTRVFMQR